MKRCYWHRRGLSISDAISLAALCKRILRRHPVALLGCLAPSNALVALSKDFEKQQHQEESSISVPWPNFTEPDVQNDSIPRATAPPPPAPPLRPSSSRQPMYSRRGGYNVQ